MLLLRSRSWPATSSPIFRILQGPPGFSTGTERTGNKSVGRIEGHEKSASEATALAVQAIQGPCRASVRRAPSFPFEGKEGGGRKRCLPEAMIFKRQSSLWCLDESSPRSSRPSCPSPSPLSIRGECRARPESEWQRRPSSRPRCSGRRAPRSCPAQRAGIASPTPGP